MTVLLDSGAVRQQILHLDEPAEGSDLDRASNKLTDLLDGKTATEVATTAQSLVGIEQQAAGAVARILEQVDRQGFEDVYYEGLGHVLSQPEFAFSEKAVPLVQALERGQVLGRLFAQALDDNDVLVVIGAEHPLEQMRETGAVLTRYGAHEDLQGVLGVLGPRRMPYWRAIAMVRFMAELMDLLVTDSLAEGRPTDRGESHATQE